MLRKGSLILLLYCIFSTNSKSTLSENGYMNLVVGISPDVPENPDVIDQIKHLMVEASRELLIATRNRAYFKQIKILLPKTWTNTEFDQPLEGEFFEDAEIRVDRPNPVYSDAPYTLRGSGCGEPGSYIHFTPGTGEKFCLLFFYNFLTQDSSMITPPMATLARCWCTSGPSSGGEYLRSTGTRAMISFPYSSIRSVDV